MSTNIAPVKPADLDNTRLHTPEEVRTWKDAVHSYSVALANIRQKELAEQQAKYVAANKTLDDSEYFQLAIARKAASDAKQAEYAAQEKASALAKIEYALSSPPIAEVLARDAYNFVSQVIGWANRGYVLSDAGLEGFGFGVFHCHMLAPVAVAKAGVK